MNPVILLQMRHRYDHYYLERTTRVFLSTHLLSKAEKKQVLLSFPVYFSYLGKRAVRFSLSYAQSHVEKKPEGFVSNLLYTKRDSLHENQASLFCKTISLLTNNFFQSFPSSKSWGFARRDINCGSGLRIAARASFSASNHEGSKTGNDDFIAFLQCISNGTEYCSDGFPCGFGRKVSFLCNDID